MSDKIQPEFGHYVQRIIITHFTVRKNKNLPKYKVYKNIKFTLFLAMSDQNSILSDQYGVVARHMSFPEEKKIITKKNYWMLLGQVVFDHHLE